LQAAHVVHGYEADRTHTLLRDIIDLQDVVIVQPGSVGGEGAGDGEDAHGVILLMGRSYQQFCHTVPSNTRNLLRVLSK
jgi:hypothetical protein